MSGEHNQNDPMTEDARSSALPPQPDWRGLSERLERLEREVPQLVRQVRRLRRRFAFVTAERDRLRAKVDKFKGNIP